MEFIDVDGVIILSHGEHSIHVSPEEVTQMDAMDKGALRAHFRSKHVNIKSKTNDAIRAIEKDIAEIPGAIQRFMSQRAQGG